jgi:hypothetical protein
MLWQAFACQSICLFDSGWLAGGWLLAGSESSQDSVYLRFAAESENLRSADWRNHQQIVIGACCCRSGLRDYEIKLNRRSAGGKSFCSNFYSAKQELGSQNEPSYDLENSAAYVRLAHTL